MELQQLKNLFSFYLECLEEEDLKSLTFNKRYLNNSFILRGKSEHLFNGENTKDSFELSIFEKSTNFFQESERLCLGYPICISDNKVSPLFFLEVETKIADDTCSIFLLDNDPLLNHHLFLETMSSEEVAKIQDELEDPSAPFENKIKKASDYFSINFCQCQTVSFEEFKIIDDR